MRKLIAGMQCSVDGKIEGADGYADWVEDWSDHYGVTGTADACLLGARMYAGYEQYWSAIQSAPDLPLPMTGKLPTAAEVDWARFAAQTPHYVLSNTLSSARWANTRFVRGLDDVAALKQQTGKDIYVIGGAHTVATLMDAGLVDELRLTLHPLIVGAGKELFAAARRRRGMELRDVQPLENGCINLTYSVR